MKKLFCTASRAFDQVKVTWSLLAEKQVAESFASIAAERPAAAIPWVRTG